jgi:glycosyltransferase involved in cell wall biosynthesis
MKNLVSIIMNCYNGEKYLHESLNSIINQHFKNWELIFFDNCSTDKSKNICKQYKDKRIKYFKTNKKIELGLARKKALAKAKGYYIAFLDVDDIWHRDKLSKQLNSLKGDKFGFSISNSIFFNEYKSINLYNNKSFKKKVFYDLISNYFISFDTVIIKRKYLNKLSHTIDERFNIIHDLDLIIRLSSICEMSYVPSSLSKWRMSKNSESFNKLKQIIDEKKIFINKISNIFKKNKLFLNSRAKFMDTLCRQEILYNVSQKNYLKVFNLIYKLKLNYKNFFLVLIIFFPFKRYIYNNILNIKY